MARSLAFGSNTCNLFALLTLGFPLAPWLNHLTLLHTLTRRIIMQKARSHTWLTTFDITLIISPALHPRLLLRRVRFAIVLLPLVSIWFQVLFHSPQRGTFHFSVALLCSLSVAEEYLALGGGPPRFTPGFTCPVILGWHFRRLSIFRYGAFTLCGLYFPV